MTDESTAMRFNQVAFSVRDRPRSTAWYGAVLGYLPAGELAPHLAPEEVRPDVAGLQGVAGATLTMGWMVDAQRFFQLEFFQYEQPDVRPLPEDWRVCDIGYSFVTYWVSDLDGVLARARQYGHEPLTDPMGARGARHVCLRDPDGIVIELVEEDWRTPTPDARPRPELGVAARVVRASVPDIENAVRFFVDRLGMTPSDVQLHTEDHEALWGLGGAQRRIRTLWSGDMWLELVEYARPVGRPWPDGYRISDQGILNVAVGTRSRTSYRQTIDGILATPGYRGSKEVVTETIEAQYTMNDDGFSVEVWFVDESADGAVGFIPTDGAQEQQGLPDATPS